MSDATWFFDFLELEPGADARAIRRAYAVRLKAIDQSIGVVAFARLRESYEAALRWRPEHATKPQIAWTSTPTSADLEALDQAQQAELLVARFVSALPGTADEDLPGLFEATTAVLRQQYVDSPSILEDRLIDLLAGARLPRRLVLFDVAYKHFHWTELDRAKELGERGLWIDAVVAQKLAWEQRVASSGDTWAGLLRQAALLEPKAFPEDLVARWPMARYLRKTIPTYLSLVIDPETIGQWQGYFDALPEARRKRAEARALSPARSGGSYGRFLRSLPFWRWVR
jgi:hypothetical protein